MAIWERFSESRKLHEFGMKNPLNSGELKRMVKAKVEKTIDIEDGKHEGKIKEIVIREKPYAYADIVILEKENDVSITCGVPFNISENTGLGIILKSFGAKLVVDEDIELDDYIKKDLEVVFETKKISNEKGTFVHVIPYSLKPKK